ncbi:MAG TPA: SDR family NAD(P)-dependent oxidoreductase, partial [bacterium]|nr:SDR family NAD(P)-dependent oxidoreductase [bacterium]
MELSGKRILVTGAARRIGKEITTLLAARGARVLLHYHRSTDEAERLARQLRKKFKTRVDLIAADLSRADQALALAETAWKKLGPIDALVNNA